jgi:hypothetical protein
VDTYYTRNRKQQEEKVKASRLANTINSVQKTTNDLFLGPFSKEEHIELRSFGISFALNTIIILSLCLYSHNTKKTNPIILNISVGSTETDTIIHDAVDILPDSFPDPQYDAPEIPVANTVSEEPISVASIDNPEKIISESSSISSETIMPSVNDILQNISQIANRESESENFNTKQSETLSNILDGLANGVATNTLSRNTQSRNGGGDIANRLVSAGAKTGAIQISIAWDTIDDIDLHIQWGAPKTVGATEYINFINKRGGQTNGFLDIDMNANQHNISVTPVENVFYTDENNLAGTYAIGIHLYKSRTGAMSVPVTVRIKTGSDIEIIRVVATPTIKYVKTIQYGWTPQLSF